MHCEIYGCKLGYVTTPRFPTSTSKRNQEEPKDEYLRADKETTTHSKESIGNFNEIDDEVA